MCLECVVSMCFTNYLTLNYTSLNYLRLNYTRLNYLRLIYIQFLTSFSTAIFIFLSTWLLIININCFQYNRYVCSFVTGTGLAAVASEIV